MQKPASTQVSTTRKLFPPLLIAGFLIGGCGDVSATASPRFVTPDATAAGPEAGGGSAPAKPGAARPGADPSAAGQNADQAGPDQSGAGRPAAGQSGTGRSGTGQSGTARSGAGRSGTGQSAKQTGGADKKTDQGTATDSGGTDGAPDSAAAGAPTPTRLPAELVGRWQGGAGDAFWYTFTRSGRLTMENRREGFSTPGVAVIDGGSITLYQNNGKVLTAARTWRIESTEVFGEPIHMLYLDDETYAKDEYFQP